MADISDVLSSVVTLIAQIVYPNGTRQPSIIGADVRIYPGWPAANGLDKDLAAGKVNISVFPRDDETNTTRFQSDWEEAAAPVDPTLTIETTATTATIGGTVQSGINIGVRCNGGIYVYNTQGGDTPTSIATALAALVNVDTPASNSGAVITIPAANDLFGRVGSVGTSVREVGRSKRSLQICLWCSSDAQRSTLAKALDPELRSHTVIAMPDGTSAQFTYLSSPLYGASGEGTLKALLYRRDLIYSAEYGITQTRVDPVVLFTKLLLSGGPAGAETYIKTIVE